MKTVSLKTLSARNKKTMRRTNTSLNNINKNPIGTINVSGTAVTDFTELHLNTTIHTIIARNTKISTFVGSTFLAKLISLDLFGSPISQEPLLDFMACMAFGPNLYKVNGQTISANTRKLVREYSNRLKPLLKQGYVIKSLKPIIKVQKVGQPEIFEFDYTNETIHEFVEKEKQIQENDAKIERLRQTVKILETGSKIDKSLLPSSDAQEEENQQGTEAASEKSSVRSNTQVLEEVENNQFESDASSRSKSSKHSKRSRRSSSSSRRSHRSSRRQSAIADSQSDYGEEEEKEEAEDYDQVIIQEPEANNAPSSPASRKSSRRSSAASIAKEDEEPQEEVETNETQEQQQSKATNPESFIDVIPFENKPQFDEDEETTIIQEEPELPAIEKPEEPEDVTLSPSFDNENMMPMKQEIPNSEKADITPSPLEENNEV